MKIVYSILNNFQILSQVILWLIIFFWIDFDLFTYMFNDCFILKIITSIVLLSNQLFLFQNLHNLNSVDSIYIGDNDKELENISEKHDFTSCKKCNIYRPKRTHHCRYCNKCILDMDHHCFIINKCIGKNNYKLYVNYLIFVEINTSLIFGITLYVCYNYFSEFNLYLLIKYILLIIISFIASVTLYFYLIFLAYLYFYNLTTLEYVYPKLRLKSKMLK
jgi:hypothetical protein